MEYMNSTHALPCQSTIIHLKVIVLSDFIHPRTLKLTTISGTGKKVMILLFLFLPLKCLTAETKLLRVAVLIAVRPLDTCLAMITLDTVSIHVTHVSILFPKTDYNIMIWVIQIMCFFYSRSLVKSQRLCLDLTAELSNGISLGSSYEIRVKWSSSFPLVMMFVFPVTHEADTICQTTLL